MAQNSLKDSLLLRDRINIKEVESLYNQQRLTITQVALRFGMSYSYMLELMRNNSIKRRAPNDYRKKISDADLKVIIERYKSGEIIRKLSEDYGVCSDTIRRYLSNAKIPKVPFRRASKNTSKRRDSPELS